MNYTVYILTTFSALVESFTAPSMKEAIDAARQKFDARIHHCIRVGVEDKKGKVIFGKCEKEGTIHEVIYRSDGQPLRTQMWRKATGEKFFDSWKLDAESILDEARREARGVGV